MICVTPMMKLLLVVVTLYGTVASTATISGYGQKTEGPLLSTFKGVHRNFEQQPDGTYTFSFSLPRQDRYEQRDADGKVSGSFSFVDNSGEEVAVKYDADEEGFRPESDHLPEIPEDTDDVQSARESFLRYYEQTVKFLNALGSDEDSDEDSSSSSEEDDDYEYDEEDSDEESDEDSSEESDEDSSEESDEDDDDSSEEDSEEEDSEEEDEDEEEEEEEDEEEEEEDEETVNVFRNKFNRGFGNRATQQDLERSASAKQERTPSKVVFPPPLPSVFGRRTSYKN